MWSVAHRYCLCRTALFTAVHLLPTDAHLLFPPPPADCPIVFASDAFLELTEYSRSEVLGRNCRFLQGPGTDRSVVDNIREAVKAGKELTVRILNYTKSGRAFWNMFTLAPMCDNEGNLK